MQKIKILFIFGGFALWLYMAKIDILRFLDEFFGKSEFLDFVIIGVKKCGTSSLEQFLRMHPEIKVDFLKNYTKNFGIFGMGLLH